MPNEDQHETAWSGIGASGVGVDDGLRQQQHRAAMYELSPIRSMVRHPSSAVTEMDNTAEAAETRTKRNIKFRLGQSGKV